MAIELESLMNALIDDLNKNYKTLAELAKENDYDPIYLSRKAKELGYGKKVKKLLLFSPEQALKLSEWIKSNRDKKNNCHS